MPIAPIIVKEMIHCTTTPEPNYIPQIITIIGSFLGVILGVFLNASLKWGKLKIYINNCDLKYYKQDNYGAMEQRFTPSDNINIIIFNLNIDVYNTSSEPKIAREIYFVLLKNNKKMKVEMHDLSTKKLQNFQFDSETLTTITISPKAVNNYRLEAYFNKNNFDWINDSEKYIEYKDSNNKAKQIKVAN